MERDRLSGKIIGCAIEVHKELGPGLLESTYQKCLAHELHLNGIFFMLEQPLPVTYKGMQLDCGYRLDFIVENQLIIELKAVEEINEVHQAQILTYLKLSGIRRGLLINFNVPLLKNGVHRFVH